ncbi:MAG: RluA family pseudouridine synthase [Bacteroidetes bacterium]|jgi:RluA family pseudouridine synthase|nr:RluA family pseudouridine synthase [Bacteroidota bacterium]
MERQTAYQLRHHRAEVLHEDGAILALAKPAGLLVIPDRYDRSIPNLQDLLSAQGEPIWTVHRLDRDTSGVIIFARTAEAHADLNTQFEGRDVRKRYLALCRGGAGPEAGTIDLPLSHHPRVDGRMVVDRKGGRESVTEYRLVERFAGYVLVEALPKTGRTHQIRIHLAETDLPIVADPIYGDREAFRLSTIKKGYREGAEPEKPLLIRTALHAASIEFRHPQSGATVMFEAALPKDLRSALQSLRKYAPLR